MTSVLRLTIHFLAALAIYAALPVYAQYVQDNNQEGSAEEVRQSVKSKKESLKKGQRIELEGDKFLTYERNPVRYAASYYYGNAERETTPVLLLHGDKGSREDFTPLIDLLANNGYAVLAPDLRGHGKSNKRYEVTPPTVEMQAVRSNIKNAPAVQRPTVTAPATRKLTDYLAEDFKPTDYAQMFKADLPLMLNTLKRVHTEGLLNLNRLVIVGAGRGCSLAVYQAVQDWQGRDSGRFTKTLVLIAPVNSDPKTDLAAVLANNRFIKNNVAVLLAVPENEDASQSTAQKILKALLEKSGENNAERRFLLTTYPVRQKAAEENEGETSESTLSEILGTGGNLGQKIYQFINERTQTFGNTENKWTKLK